MFMMMMMMIMIYVAIKAATTRCYIKLHGRIPDRHKTHLAGHLAVQRNNNNNKKGKETSTPH